MEEEILILADPQGNAWDFTQKVYKKLTEPKEESEGILTHIYQRFLKNHKQEKPYKLEEIKIKTFEDEEICPEIQESVREQRCYFIQDSSMYPQDWLVSLIFLKDNFTRSYSMPTTFVLPYMKYSRQDRRTDERAPISFAAVLNVLKGSGINIMTTDLHNPSAASGFEHFENLRAYPVTIEHLKRNHKKFLENCMLVSPDVGAMQIANSYAKRLNLGIVSGYKKRDEPNVVRELEILGEVKDKNVLVTDDMIDTAGTLCKCAKVLKQKGAKQIYACATHGLFSGNAKEKIEKSPLEKVIVTDSIPQKPEGKIEIVSLTDLFAEVIYRTSHKISISELYK